MHRRFFLAGATFALLTSVRVVDLATTLRFDPSLSHEGNPIVMIFGGGLAGLVVSNLAIWVVCTVFLVAFWRGESLRVANHQKRFREFVSAWINTVVRPRRPLRSSLPGGANWHEGLQAIRLCGLALSWAIIVGSVAAIHAWLSTYGASAPTQYEKFYSALRIGRLNYFIWLTTPMGFLLGTGLFFWSEFREQIKGTR